MMTLQMPRYSILVALVGFAFGEAYPRVDSRVSVTLQGVRGYLPGPGLRMGLLGTFFSRVGWWVCE